MDLGTLARVITIITNTRLSLLLGSARVKFSSVYFPVQKSMIECCIDSELDGAV